MDSHANFNIIEEYYYPDSDLETIQEEPSVIDSEDDRSTIYNSRRNSSTASLAYDENDYSKVNRQSLKSPFFQGNFGKDPLNSVKPSLVNSNGFYHPSSTYHSSSLNGITEQIEGKQSSMESLSQQKIIYAKCLTSSESPPITREDRSNFYNNHKEVPAGIASPMDMFEAAKLGDLNALNSFSKEELSNSVDERGNTPLHLAAEHGKLACVKTLASFFSAQMISLPNDDLLTATGLAVKNNHFDCVKWLMLNTDARDELTVSQRTSSIDGSTTRPPLPHVAARFDQFDIMDWLCNEMSRDDISIDVGDQCSNTPVHVAARYGHLRCIQTLVARGASVTILNSDGDTPIQAAQRHGHETTVGYLVVVETCVSLAQQLVALRHDMDNLKKETDKLQQEVNVKHKETKDASTTTDSNDCYTNAILSKSTERSFAQSKKEKLLKKILQEQPPPPKLIETSKPKEAISPPKKLIFSQPASTLSNTTINKQKEILQLNINDILDGPGIDVDGKPSLKVSDIDPPKKDVIKNEIQTSPMRSDVNFEVKALTKGNNKNLEQKPWEKFTMDEMIRRVREMRYQPSPSISHCTEDSTLEPVEVMKERMAAATRWFLVEKGRDKSKNLTISPKKKEEVNKNIVSTKQAAHHPHVLETRKAHGRPINPSITQQNQNTAKMQHAIQEYYHRGDSLQTSSSRIVDEAKLFKTVQPLEKDSCATMENKRNEITTGTMKFMVSHASERTKKISSNLEKNSGKLPNQPTPDLSPVISPSATLAQRSNSYRRAVQSKNLEEKPQIIAKNVQTSVSSTSSDSGSEKKSAKAKGIATVIPKKSMTLEHSNQPIIDPLQKRTAKEVNAVWNEPKNSNFGKASHVGSKVIENGKVGIKLDLTPRFNQWTLPKHLRPTAYTHSQHSFDDEDEDDQEAFNVSEIPELKTEISNRQTSFLRRVQGKLKY